MIRTPTLHYDYIMGAPGAAEFHRVIEEQFRTFSNEELLGGKIPQVLNSLDGATRISSYMMQLYKRFGQHTYVVGPKVQELFRRTQLARVTPQVIQPPVPAFYVALADCPWQFWGGERTKLHHLSGLYVSFTKVYQGRRPAPGTSPKAAPELHDSISIVLWGKANERSLDKFDDALLWFSISLDKWVAAGQDLETFFANHSVMTTRTDPQLEKLDPFAHPILPAEEGALTKQREALVSTLRLVLNLCLYMGSEDPDLEVNDWRDRATELENRLAAKKSTGKRKVLERQLSNLRRTRVVYVGPMFEELPGPEVEGPAEHRKSQGGTHASPLEHGVAPHWQRYWVGSGENRKVKWRLKGMYVRGAGKPDRTVTKLRE